MSNHLANLLLAAYLLTTPLLSIYLFSVVERRYGDRLCAWFDRCVDMAFYWKLRWEEFLREHVWPR